METVYLLHFERRYRHAGHYMGTTSDLAARLAQHRAGRGARLLTVIQTAGIGWQLVRTWPGGRERERQLKAQGGHARLCPVCHPPRRRWCGQLWLSSLAQGAVLPPGGSQ
jgi:predicted GIY-YIG superfamily endonuclease